jgi:hypothetical protein
MEDSVPLKKIEFASITKTPQTLAIRYAKNRRTL